jgi:hypothetical protein
MSLGIIFCLWQIKNEFWLILCFPCVGAWCWYKTMTLLEESGYRVDAVDLTGSGVHSFDTNSIATLAQYVKPLTDILEKLWDGDNVFALSLSLSLSLSSSALSLFVFIYAYRVNIVNAWALVLFDKLGLVFLLSIAIYKDKNFIWL